MYNDFLKCDHYCSFFRRRRRFAIEIDGHEKSIDSALLVALLRSALYFG